MTDNKPKDSWLDIIFGGGKKPTARPASLDLGLLRTAPDEDWLGCIDFGTAFSKICVVRRHAAGETEPEDVHPLRLGPQATAGGRSHFAPSTLYIVKDRIYFGAEALKVRNDQNDSDRDCFQSPKQVLSEMDDGALQTMPPARQDPTQSFTRGELMTLLLAHLVWQAHTAAIRDERLNGLPRLRLARPAWRAEKVRRGEAQLLKLFATAFALAGTLKNQLTDAGGLPVAQAKAVLGLPRDDDELVNLISKRIEIGKDDADSIQRGFVLEATAVAAAAIHPEQGKRRVLVVVDVGAGTTDYGAFVTTPGRGDGRIGELRRGQHVALRAGNFIDEQVVALLKDKAGLTDGMPSSDPSIAHLKRRAAELKQSLFETQRLTEELPNGQLVRTSLAELLARPPVQDFAEDLREKFSETFAVALEFIHNLNRDLRPEAIEVILTGGGSELPMVHALIDQARKSGAYPVKLVAGAPPWSRKTTWAPAFAQLAVAVGGAMPVMPQQR